MIWYSHMYSVIIPIAFVAIFQSSWKWFIYTRSQNVNRKTDDGPPRKKSKLESVKKHDYPTLPPPSANDEESDDRNMRRLLEEWGRNVQVTETIKDLFVRTHYLRRALILGSEYSSASGILQEFPMLKRCMYVSLKSLVYLAPLFIISYIGEA